MPGCIAFFYIACAYIYVELEDGTYINMQCVRFSMGMCRGYGKVILWTYQDFNQHHSFIIICLSNWVGLLVFTDSAITPFVDLLGVNLLTLTPVTASTPWQ